MAKKELVFKITDILSDMKAEDIVAFKITEVSSIADYLVICTGSSDVHINAIAERLNKEMREIGETPIAKDGEKGSRWICLDYGEVIVHIMGSSERDFYSLESIWGECENVYAEAY
jgi:ribosome-associated protein